MTSATALWKWVDGSVKWRPGDGSAQSSQPSALDLLMAPTMNVLAVPGVLLSPDNTRSHECWS